MNAKTRAEVNQIAWPVSGFQETRNADTAGQGEVQARLKELVQRFQICFEVLPDNYFVNKKLRQIGFTLDLLGTHEEGVEHPQPGCGHCRKVWRALQAIAEWIVPKEVRGTDYDIIPYDQAIHYDPARKFRPEVSLRIWIRHRSGFDREVDACEVRCLNEMTGRLAEIGARKGKWGLD